MTEVAGRRHTEPSWPGVWRVPRAPMRAAVAGMLLRRLERKLPLRIVRPGERPGADERPVLRLIRPGDFLRRVGADGLIGFGESYQAGDWDSPDLPAVLGVLASHVDDLVPGAWQRLRSAYTATFPASDANTVRNQRHNIERHYDLSNELFALFLDETMTYSSALFDGPSTWDDLATAQRRKIDRLLDGAGVGPGSRVLEIGTGWGELALRAAARGALVETVTLSWQQQLMAQARAAAAGLSDRITVKLRDYREITGRARFDAIVSVEMIEAVGERYWSEYFGTLRRLLAPGGRVALQAITMPHERMLATRRTYTWIQKYIFPGGLIPSTRVIEALSGLSVVDGFAFGQDYARTLQLWRERFLAHAHRLPELGFDDTFRRTWDLYLAYSEAGFASGYLNVHQYVLEAK